MSAEPLVSRLTEIVPTGERVLVTGLVQGVGFRPTVWRLAHSLVLAGQVYNNASGVVIELWGRAEARELFIRLLYEQKPRLARIDNVVRQPVNEPAPGGSFRITESRDGLMQTGVAPDAAVCTACARETLNTSNAGGRRSGYPFTNCTHCGPRLSIVAAVPYDRGNTSMAQFPLCGDCRNEYEDPADRRFHAQPIACPSCGPRIWLEDSQGEIELSSIGAEDTITAVVAALRKGAIIAIKGIGGFHLACDSGNPKAIALLRQRKQRPDKPFALMAADIIQIRDYSELDEAEIALLTSAQAPIVLLKSRHRLPEELAPGLDTLGFMLPYSPLHLLLMRELEHPLVMTSGNAPGAPQCIDNQEAREKLGNLADFWLMHDRKILNRVDDSVVRLMMGDRQLLRRARGYAPASLTLPPGFAAAPDILALGGELKSTFCLLKNGAAVLSQYIGDLEQAPTFDTYQNTIERYITLFAVRPRQLVADMHPEYLSSQYARERSCRDDVPLVRVQHHHAHLAACMADNNLPLDHPAVLGIVLDGLGWGEDGSAWGGEVMLLDYRNYKRLGSLQPMPLPGGSQAIRHPWRSCFAQIDMTLGWDQCRAEFDALELLDFLQEKPLTLLQQMVEQGINSPYSSSCGRLFDAVAAALGLCRERVSYEGQAAIELEALSDTATTGAGYAFSTCHKKGLLQLDQASLWKALLQDLQHGECHAKISYRFHQGLAVALVEMVEALWTPDNPRILLLSGGVFQNKILLELVVRLADERGFRVLCHHRVPANDGGLSLGQAVVAAARALDS